jgi:glycine hydroxymethyltransferase
LQNYALKWRPKLIVAGYSASMIHYDYKRMKEVCDSVGAYLHCDMAHVSGLVATGNCPNLFDHADIVTSTTHKTLQGPRGAIMFFRKGVRSTNPKTGAVTNYDLETPLNESVYPGHQGGVYLNRVAAIGVVCKLAKTPEFKDYVDRCIANSRKMADSFAAKGYTVNSGQTENHMVIVDISHKGVDAIRAEHF